MKTSYRAFIGICYLMIGMMLVGAGGCPFFSQAGAGTTISGKITDENSKPIANASVETVPQTKTVKTDEAGNYAIDGVQAGQYTVKASKTGYKTKSLEEIKIEEPSVFSCKSQSIIKTVDIVLSEEITDNYASGTIVTIAGTGTWGYSGDGGKADSAQLSNPFAVAIDGNGTGNIYIADYNNNCIRKVSREGIITTIAGTGTAGYSGDGGQATSAQLREPTGVAIDGSGNIYIAGGNNLIRKVSSGGIITTIAGTGVYGYSGDGGPATSAQLRGAFGVAISGYSGNIYIADCWNDRIRKVSSSEDMITTIAGIGEAGYSGDEGPATSAQLNNPIGVAVDGSGNIYIADSNNNRIRKVSKEGIIMTIAGTGTAGFSGDEGQATALAPVKLDSQQALLV